MTGKQLVYSVESRCMTSSATTLPALLHHPYLLYTVWPVSSWCAVWSASLYHHLLLYTWKINTFRPKNMGKNTVGVRQSASSSCGSSYPPFKCHFMALYERAGSLLHDRGVIFEIWLNNTFFRSAERCFLILTRNVLIVTVFIVLGVCIDIKVHTIFHIRNHVTTRTCKYFKDFEKLWVLKSHEFQKVRVVKSDRVVKSYGVVKIYSIVKSYSVLKSYRVSKGYWLLKSYEFW